MSALPTAPSAARCTNTVSSFCWLYYFKQTALQSAKVRAHSRYRKSAGMPRNKGIGRSHKRGTGNNKAIAAKRALEAYQERTAAPRSPEAGDWGWQAFRYIYAQLSFLSFAQLHRNFRETFAKASGALGSEHSSVSQRYVWARTQSELIHPHTATFAQLSAFRDPT